jgi:cytochrome P450
VRQQQIAPGGEGERGEDEQDQHGLIIDIARYARPVTEPYRLTDVRGRTHQVNARLRERGAAVAVVLPGDVDGFVITRHEPLREFLTDPDVAKAPAHFAALRRGDIPAGWPLIGFATVPGMTTADGADLRRLRGLVSQVFTPRRIEELRPRVVELTETLLDDLADVAARQDGVADLRQHFALPLPLNVISELLGVDERYRAPLHRLSNVVTSAFATPDEAIAAGQELPALLADVTRERRAHPGDDLTSALIAVREDNGDRLSEAELIGILQIVIIAGHETTLNLITNAVRALSAHRDQLELVRAGRASWAQAVEETLRFDGPLNYFPFRYPVRDLAVDGVTIPAGTPVLAGYASAGRDQRVYGETADSFDIGRDSTRHLSFGHGPHFCLGAPLARLEATVALHRLFTRFPQLDVAVAEEELRRDVSFMGNTATTLPVRI